MTLNFFVIRQSSTGLLLPPGGKGFGGHTKQEPSADRPPRMFISEKVAKSAMKAYIRGRWKETYSTSWEGEPDYDGPEPKKGTERDPKDFEVRMVTLEILDLVHISEITNWKDVPA
jgi:hypothetical protein